MIGNASISKEAMKVSVDNLATIVTLKALDQHVELVENVSIEFFESGGGV